MSTNTSINMNMIWVRIWARGPAVVWSGSYTKRSVVSACHLRGKWEEGADARGNVLILKRKDVHQLDSIFIAELDKWRQLAQGVTNRINVGRQIRQSLNWIRKCWLSQGAARTMKKGIQGGMIWADSVMRCNCYHVSCRCVGEWRADWCRSDGGGKAEERRK